MMNDVFNFDDGLPPTANIPIFRDKLTRLSVAVDVQKTTLPNDEFVQNLLGLFGNVLDYIDLLEQDLFDLKVVLSTTVQHSTDLENDLSSQTQLMSNKSEKFEFIVNSSADWMALINREYCYEAVNESLAAVFGKTSAQMVSRPLEKVWGSEFFTTHIQKSIDSCLEGHEIQDHLFCQLPKHQERWCEFTYTPFRNPANEITHVVCIARDISARRRAEDLLREHTLYLDKVNDAIIVIGMDQKVYYWNKSAERIYGWKREQVIDKKKIESIIPSTEKLEQIMRNVSQHGEWRGEMVHCSKARKDIAVDSSWTLINTRQDEPFVVITNTDITEKKLLEQQFLRIQRMEGIGSVASGIAHDLNNVLSALFMSIRLLKPRCTDEQSSQILDLLDNSAKRGVSLVRQILEFARGIEGNELLIPVSKILGEIQEFVNSTFPKSITTTCQFPADLWQVVGNPTQIHQVILNLCINAKDAMATGGSLTLVSENRIVREKNRPKVDNARPGTYVLLTVRDTGAGISKAVLNKIFDPFFTTKEKGKGTGLGLSTVQTIVKNHGGFMEIKSKVNKGTEFNIYLPATPPSVHNGHTSGVDEQLHLNAMRRMSGQPWPH